MRTRKQYFDSSFTTEHHYKTVATLGAEWFVTVPIFSHVPRATLNVLSAHEIRRIERRLIRSLAPPLNTTGTEMWRRSAAAKAAASARTRRCTRNLRRYRNQVGRWQSVLFNVYTVAGKRYVGFDCALRASLSLHAPILFLASKNACDASSKVRLRHQFSFCSVHFSNACVAPVPAPHALQLAKSFQAIMGRFIAIQRNTAPTAYQPVHIASAGLHLVHQLLRQHYPLSVIYAAINRVASNSSRSKLLWSPLLFLLNTTPRMHPRFMTTSTPKLSSWTY